MKRNISSALLALTFAPSLFLGCRSDTNWAADTTNYRLTVLAQNLALLSRLGEDISAFNSVDDLVGSLLKRNWILHDEADSFRKDYWRNPFVLRINSDRGTKKVRIISGGPNGLIEEGDGDDLYVEVTIHSDNGEITIVDKTLTSNGRSVVRQIPFDEPKHE